MTIQTATSEDINYLFSPQAIRDRAYQLYDLTLEGKGHFTVHIEQLDTVCDYVQAVIEQNYPDLKIPFHSRWGHFKVGGIDRLAPLNHALEHLSPTEKARSKIDLAIVSVLLDAGAGNQWQFHEKSSHQYFSRSEGLAVASLEMFLNGDFSSNSNNHFQVDAQALIKFTADQLENGFQVTSHNPLIGIEGRVHLLQSLGTCLLQSSVFSEQRPGNLLDALLSTHGSHIQAEHILQILLKEIGPIWPSRIRLNQTNLGDVWHHPLLGSPDTIDSLIPFHKLSQWLTYSLIEPIAEAGNSVNGVEHLTGLAEYRNGGLLIDKGLITLKDDQLFSIAHQPSSPLIIEWRALTIVLLDKIAKNIRETLHRSETEFPLAKVLEGGTWWAGRKAALEKRSNGEPPLILASDGTVF